MEPLHIKAVGGAYAGAYPVRCLHGTTIEAGLSDARSADPVLFGGSEQTSDTETLGC